MSYFSHESAVIDEGAVIGEGTNIWHFSHVMPGARIGKDCVIGQNVYVGNVTIGDGVRIQNNVSVYEGVLIEDYVFLGPSAVFTNVLYPRAEVSRKHALAETKIRRGATIGANATIVCGVTVGEYAFVGAGAVVRREVPAYSLALGVPARVRGWMCRCGQRLALPATLSNGDRSRCRACGEEYREDHSALVRVGA